MNAIVDASSLIILARLNALWLLERTFGLVGIVPGVESETVLQGKARGYTDAQWIERAIINKKIVVITPTTIEEQLANSLDSSTPALSHTDCMTLVCAKEQGLTLVMEERRGRNVAIAYNINYITIQVLPLQGFISEQVSFTECNDLLTRISRAMHTDRAVLTILQTAAAEIQRLRSM